MTKQTTLETIDGHRVELTIEGPEAQDIDHNRIGSDALIVKCESALADLKAEVES